MATFHGRTLTELIRLMSGVSEPVNKAIDPQSLGFSALVSALFL